MNHNYQPMADANVPSQSLTFNSRKDYQDALVTAHFPLVMKLARCYSKNYSNALEMADLVSAGEEALVLASRTFDPSVGAPFDAYAAKSIKNAFKKTYKELHPVVFVRVQDAAQFDALEGELWSDYEHELKRQNRIDEVRDLVGQLADREHRLYELRFVDDMTLQEMGAYYGVSHQAVDHRLYRMYNKLGVKLAPRDYSYRRSA